MEKDILNRRIKIKYTNQEKYYFGKFYEYNGKWYQVIRLKINSKHKTPIIILNILNDNNKENVIYLNKIEFLLIKFYTKKRLIRKNNFKYRNCYFSNTIIKKNINIIEKLYELGYENYSRMTSIGFHQYDFCVINKKGEIMTTNENENELIQKGYRNLFDFWKEN